MKCSYKKIWETAIFAKKWSKMVKNGLKSVWKAHTQKIWKIAKISKNDLKWSKMAQNPFWKLIHKNVENCKIAEKWFKMVKNVSNSLWKAHTENIAGAQLLEFLQSVEFKIFLEGLYTKVVSLTVPYSFDVLMGYNYRLTYWGR